MTPLAAFVPIDRLLRPEGLPNRLCGTVLFADLSGFTPLAHRLVETLGPRRGPEILTEQLDRIYGVLIDEVHRFHGSVTAFGGDAITVFFDDSSGRAATSCALALQERMTRLRAAPSANAAAGSSLSVKIGLAAGELRRFLIGEPAIQRFDVLAGKTVDRMAAAEKYARPGEIIVDDAIAAGLGLHLEVSETRGAAPARFHVVGSLRERCPEMPWPALRKVDPEWLRSWVLPPLRTRLESGSSFSAAELRTSVPMFVQFDGIDFDGDDAAEEKLDAWIRWVQEVVAAVDGFLIDICTGDKGSHLYISFGAPVSHQDDPDRATSAAMRLVHPPESLRYIKGVKIGISQGRMRAGPYGAPARRTYGVIGAEVNVAARLMSSATQGQVLVTSRIAQHAGRNFVFDELPPIRVKGIEVPLKLAELRARRDPDRHRLAADTTPVGRRDERLFLEKGLSALACGESGVVIIEGEAGIGKSRLARYAAGVALSQGVGLLVGQGEPLTGATPYAAWRGLLMTLLGLDGRTALASCERVLDCLPANCIEDASLLNPLLGLDLPEPLHIQSLNSQERAARTQDLLIEFLSQVLWPGAKERNARLLIIEDAHWLDAASLSLLARAVSKIKPLLCVITARPQEDPVPLPYRQIAMAEATRRLALSALSKEEVAELLVRHLNVHDLPAALVELVSARGGGNPFFSEELVLALRDSGLIRILEGKCIFYEEKVRSDDRFPETVEGIVRERIDRLPPDHQLTIKVASVFGRVFLGAAIEETYPPEERCEEVRGYLEGLIRSGVTLLDSPEPRYAFKHIIIQQVAYEGLLFQQRRQLHRAAALWIERTYAGNLRPVYALLAHHFHGAEDLEQAIRYLKLAGDEAAHANANNAAVSLYREALALLEALPDRRAHAEEELLLLTALAGALMPIRGYCGEEIEETIRRAEDLAERSGLRPPYGLQWNTWILRLHQERLNEAERIGRQMLERGAQLGDDSLILEAHHSLWSTLYWKGEFQAVRTEAEIGVRMYREEHHAGCATIGHDSGTCARYFLGHVLFLLGHPEKARAFMDEALAMAYRQRHPQTLALTFAKAIVLDVDSSAIEALERRAQDYQALAARHHFAVHHVLASLALLYVRTLRKEAKPNLTELQDILATNTSGIWGRCVRQIIIPRILIAAGQRAIDLVWNSSIETRQVDEFKAYEAARWIGYGDLLMMPPAEPDRAAAAYRRALATAQQQGARMHELRALVGLVRVLDAGPDGPTRREARQALASCYAWFTEGFTTPDLIAAKALLAAQ